MVKAVKEFSGKPRYRLRVLINRLSGKTVFFYPEVIQMNSRYSALMRIQANFFGQGKLKARI